MVLNNLEKLSSQHVDECEAKSDQGLILQEVVPRFIQRRDSDTGAGNHTQHNGHLNQFSQ